MKPGDLSREDRDYLRRENAAIEVLRDPAHRLSRRSALIKWLDEKINEGAARITEAPDEFKARSA